MTLPGKTATIILTGDHNTDIPNAAEAWRKLNPGKKLPENSTFHHDLLHATEHTVTIDGKKTKVLVGKMHLVPTDINKAVFHEGSASVAKKERLIRASQRNAPQPGTKGLGPVA